MTEEQEIEIRRRAGKVATEMAERETGAHFREIEHCLRLLTVSVGGLADRIERLEALAVGRRL